MIVISVLLCYHKDIRVRGCEFSRCSLHFIKSALYSVPYNCGQVEKKLSFNNQSTVLRTGHSIFVINIHSSICKAFSSLSFEMSKLFDKKRIHSSAGSVEDLGV
jgi:hypothetical protein